MKHPGEDRRGRGEGTKTHPPPEQLGCRELTVATAGRWEDSRQRTSEPQDTTDTAEEDGSAGPRPWQCDSADGARSEHGALAHREYNLLASEATEGV